MIHCAIIPQPLQGVFRPRSSRLLVQIVDHADRSSLWRALRAVSQPTRDVGDAILEKVQEEEAVGPTGRSEASNCVAAADNSFKVE